MPRRGERERRVERGKQNAFFLSDYIQRQSQQSTLFCFLFWFGLEREGRSGEGRYWLCRCRVCGPGAQFQVQKLSFLKCSFLQWCDRHDWAVQLHLGLSLWSLDSVSICVLPTESRPGIQVQSIPRLCHHSSKWGGVSAGDVWLVMEIFCKTLNAGVQYGLSTTAPE